MGPRARALTRFYNGVHRAFTVPCLASAGTDWTLGAREVADRPPESCQSRLKWDSYGD